MTKPIVLEGDIFVADGDYFGQFATMSNIDQSQDPMVKAAEQLDGKRVRITIEVLE